MDTAGLAPSAASHLSGAKRIVVKIGSALLVDEATGEIRRDWLDALTDDIASLRDQNKEILVVSSGAIAVGRRHLGLTQATLKLEEKQAAAATGQIRLAHAYQDSLARHGLSVAQVLLSLDDTEQRRRHLNARATINTLLGLGAVPVINENDTVATAEIRFGDNDRLGARVAQMASADCLILLSDIDGLYSKDPRAHGDAEHIPEVSEITPEIEAMAGQARSDYSTGGMITKLAAAKIANSAGCKMAIIDGHALHALKNLEQGGKSTWFLATATPRNARKQWIASALQPSGTLVLDDGAVAALSRGTSLLPAGVTKVNGRFDRGDLVTLTDSNGREIGRGLSAYGAEDAGRIIGHNSREIADLLGYRGRDELVHRDDLVLA